MGLDIQLLSLADYTLFLEYLSFREQAHLKIIQNQTVLPIFNQVLKSRSLSHVSGSLPNQRNSFLFIYFLFSYIMIFIFFSLQLKFLFNAVLSSGNSGWEDQESGIWKPRECGLLISKFELSFQALKIEMMEFLSWISGLRTQHCLHEDAGSVPGLTHWVKDPALLQAVAQVTDAAQIRCCHGSGMAGSCSSDSTLPGNFRMPQVQP